MLTYFLWNCAAFLLVRMDKYRARHGRWRVPERIFFLWALLFGAAGILLGMYIYRHKTRHASFVFGIPLLLVVNFACYYFALSKRWVSFS
ncbi:DUF1294 domain-containing protein [Anaerosporomusa subterranea]|uniref:DUF1294 domain-containing protein n=1 Tax=Anaerosporomusa subterranea TaxID=1794912 RepID=UPI0018D37CC0|nr:DUF1294 domain-containing protein [Anaerosporomusa subterranea]